MKLIKVEPVANGYALYNFKHYLIMFNRKENAEYVANLIERVKEVDNKNYKFRGGK